MDDQLTAMDDWCKKQLARLTGEINQHVGDRKSIYDSECRRMLGEIQAYTAMRSFIHGCRKQ